MSFIIIMVSIHQCVGCWLTKLHVCNCIALIIKCNRNGEYFIASSQINDIETNELVQFFFHWVEYSIYFFSEYCITNNIIIILQIWSNSMEYFSCISNSYWKWIFLYEWFSIGGKASMRVRGQAIKKTLDQYI